MAFKYDRSKSSRTEEVRVIRSVDDKVVNAIDELVRSAMKVMREAIYYLRDRIENKRLTIRALSIFCGDAGLADGLMSAAMSIAESLGIMDKYEEEWREFNKLKEEFWRLRDESLTRGRADVWRGLL